MNRHTICMLGGTGFVGRHLSNRLTRHGYSVKVLTRRSQRYRDLAVNPGIKLVEVNTFNPETLRKHFSGADAVINLIGILNESRASDRSFDRLHAELPGEVAAIAVAAGVPRLLHMSALHADAAGGSSRYLQTKGEGEERSHATADKGLQVTSFRPSVIFGPGDSFFNRFAALLRMSPLFFPLACAGSRFAPVYVGDVVAAFCAALENDATAGQRLELCGPDCYTLKQLVEYTRDTLGLTQRIIGLGDGLSRLQATLLGIMPGKPFTLDNYRSLQTDSLCDHNALGDLGITPTPIPAVVPGYLDGRNARGRYASLRRAARRQ